MLCPKCNAESAHRSHRKGLFERLASLFAYYPYRCRACHYRFMRFRYGTPKLQAGEVSSTEREIRSTRLRIKWKRKRREFLLFVSGFLLFLCFLYYITRMDTFAGN